MAIATRKSFVEFTSIFFVRGLGALFSMLSTILIAKVAAPEVAGQFFLLLNVLIFLSVFFSFGLGTFSTKKFAIANTEKERFSYLLLAFGAVLLTAFFAFVLSAFLNKYLLEYDLFLFLLESRFDIIVMGGGWGLLVIYSGAVLGLGGQNKSTVMLNIAPYFPVFSLGVVAFIFHNEVKLDYLVSGLKLGLVLGLTLALFSLFKSLKKVGFTLKKISVNGCFYFWVVTLSQAFLFSGLVVFSSQFFASKDLAAFYTAHRICAAVTFPMIVVNMIALPKLSKAYSEENYLELHRLARMYTYVPLIIGVPFLFGLALFSEEVMASINVEYADYSVLLVMMLAGNFVAMLCGPVVPILTMTNAEKSAALINLLIIFPAFVLAYNLANEYGVYGLAATVAIVLVFQNAAFVVSIYRKFKFVPAMRKF